MAVVALICGIIALLSFAHPVFLLSAGAAILLGILADRKIRRLSDVLTGRQIAQAGIALGLIFGLSAITTTSVQAWILRREATKFARTFENVINTGTFDDAVWYSQNPRARAGKTPADLVAEMKKSIGGPLAVDMEQAALKKLKTEMAETGAKVEFVKIEQQG